MTFQLILLILFASMYCAYILMMLGLEGKYAEIKKQIRTDSAWMLEVIKHPALQKMSWNCQRTKSNKLKILISKYLKIYKQPGWFNH